MKIRTQFTTRRGKKRRRERKLSNCLGFRRDTLTEHVLRYPGFL